MVRFASVVVGFVCFAATNAWAQGSTDKPVPSSSLGTRTDDAKAAALRAEGEEFVKADDCKGALDPLRSAWALREDGKTAVLLGECELRLGQEPEAAQHLARALELLPDGAERTRVESMFQEMKGERCGDRRVNSYDQTFEEATEICHSFPRKSGPRGIAQLWLINNHQ